MIKRQTVFIFVIYLLWSFGLAIFLSIYFQSSSFTILEHSLNLNLLFFLFWAASFSIILSAWIYLSRWEAKVGTVPDECRPLDLASVRWRGFLTSLPLGFLLPSAWLLHFYTNRDDLRIRLRLLAVFIFLAILFLKLADYMHFSKKRPSLVGKMEAKFSSLSLRQRLVILFLVSFFIYQAAAFILVSEGTSFSGDEPYYLMTTHSLLKDGDINLANNYAQKDYFAFYSKKDHPRLNLGIYGRFGRKGRDYIYPINLPGISVLMLPFYWLSGFFQGKALTFILKASLSFWASLLGLQIYLYAKDLWQKERLSLGLWTLYSFSSPIFFYSVHLYPEVPIALFSLYIFRKISGRSPLSTFQMILAGVLLGLFPWFGLKYNFLFWPLFFVSLYFLIKEHKAGRKILAFAALPLVSMILFYVFVYALYGTFSPFAVYEGALTPERTEALKQTLLNIPLRARVETFLDYFLDQRDGLLLYSPLYLFAFLGLVEMYRQRKRIFWCLLLIGLPFLVNYAFFTHRQGACPQGRVLTPISWIAAVALGYFLVHNRKKIFAFLFGIASATSFIIAGLLLSHPSFLYQPTTHDFTSRPGELFIYLSNLHFFLPPLLPSFIKIDNTRYWPNYIWVLALLLFILTYVVSRKELPFGRAIPLLFALSALLSSFFLWVLYPRSVLSPTKTIRYSPQRALGFSLFPAGKGVVAKESGDFYLHFEKSYKFIFGSRTKLGKVKLLFGSDKGEYEVRMTFFDLPVFEGKTAFETKEMILEPAAFYPLKNLFLYEINITLVHRTSESMLVDPYCFQVIPWKE
jgi:hypothetical protein